MKIKLLPKIIAENISSDSDTLTDAATSELYCMIIKLKAAILLDGMLEVSKFNEHNQVFVEGVEMWFNSDEYLKFGG
jgi:hypothetical protein